MLDVAAVNVDGHRSLYHLDGNDQLGIRAGTKERALDSRQYPSHNTHTLSRLKKRMRNAVNSGRQNGSDAINLLFRNRRSAVRIPHEVDNPRNLENT